jgi:filamentous hemagglutinin family protein
MKKAVTLKRTLWVITLLLSAENVSANPQGAHVVSGQASLANPSATALTITNSPNAIINWQSFDINHGEITRFIQQNSASAVLNRVVGNGLTASQIMGTLASNGKVFLVNPNGIVFGSDSVVDTAGLIASSLNISDQDFLNNNLRFDGNASNGAIENKGYIKAGLNGDVFLIAPNIENSGIIETSGGDIVLAAGEKVSLASFENENIVFQVQSADNKVTNLGSINTNGGAAELFAGTITHSGAINADSVFVDKQGHVVLAAISDINIEADSVITANGPKGGDIHIESDSGDTIVKGSIEANGNTGKGGAIHVLGERVGLFDNALVSANGKAGGGEILIGGDFQGKNLDIKNAEQTAVGDEVVLQARATDEGDGGKVIVWADDHTSFHGNLDVRGGDVSGEGGFVEVSGKNTLSYHGEIDVTALNGLTGTVLFDPKNINIVISGPDALATNDDFAENSTGTSDIDPNSISTLLGTGAAVTLQASNDLTITDTINVGGGNATLTLQAGRSIAINASIDTNGGDFNATANSPLADGVVNAERDAGAAEFRLDAGRTIDTNGGDITIEVSDGAGLTNNTSGNLVLEELSFVEADGGTIDLKSRAGSVVLEGSGTSGATLRSTAGTGGNITITTDDLDVQAGSIISTPGTFSGNLTIQPFSTNQDISIGTAGTGTPLEITAAELSRMTSIDTLTIGRSTDTGTLTISEDLTSVGINAASLILQNGSIQSDNVIDLSAGNENLKLVASTFLDINNGIDAGNVTLEGGTALFAPITTLNIDSFTLNGTDAPTNTIFDGAGTTLFRSSTTLGAVVQADGTIDTSAGQTVTMNGNYNWAGGTIDGTVTSNAVTTIGGTVTLNGVFNNNGTFSWATGNINGTVAGGSGFNNNSGATFTALGDGIFSQALTNAGTLAKLGSVGTTTFNGGITTNTGGVTASSGTIEFDEYVQNAGITILNGGNITDISGDGFNFNAGTLKGTGTLTTNFLNINNGATFAPGSSPGTFNVVGNLNLSPTSILSIELGGTNQGVDYDFLDVTGNVALDGVLDISLFGGFTGVVGNSFDVIQSGGAMTGSFATVNIPTGYSFNTGIFGSTLYRLGLLTVPITPSTPTSTSTDSEEEELEKLQEKTTNEVLVLEENFDAWNLEDVVFNDKSEEEYDDQAQICT